MKTMLIGLIAVLGLAVGTVALSHKADASRTFLFSPNENGNG
jgi:hypothetical protein